MSAEREKRASNGYRQVDWYAQKRKGEYTLRQAEKEKRDQNAENTLGSARDAVTLVTLS